MSLHKSLFTALLFALSAPSFALSEEQFYGTWQYDSNSPIAEYLPSPSVRIGELDEDETAQAEKRCGKNNFAQIFNEAQGEEIIEDLAEQMPAVLAGFKGDAAEQFTDFSKQAATWFKPNQTYQMVTWNCGDVGGNYYFVNERQGVATSGGEKVEDTYVIEINK